MSSARVVSQAVVTQTLNGGATGRFVKEILYAPVDRGEVALVRKRLAEGPDGKPAKTRGAVVLVHGFGQNRYTWHLERRSFVNYLAQRGYDVFNLELRGHGRSRDAGSRHPRKFEEYVEHDAVAGLEAALAASGHARAFVAGHSLGGAVAFALAGHAPEKVAGVISVAGVFLFGTGQPIFRYASAAYRRFARFLDPALRLAPFVPVDLAGQLLVAGRRVVDHPRFAASPLQVWYPGTMEPDVLRERMTRGMDRTGAGVLRQMIEWAATGAFVGLRSGNDYAAAFTAADVPLLVLAADEDKLCPPKDCKSAYEASRSRDKSYVEFGPSQGGGSWGHVDVICGERAPRFVWPVVADWMDQRTPASVR